MLKSQYNVTRALYSWIAIKQFYRFDSTIFLGSGIVKFLPRLNFGITDDIRLRLYKNW